MAPDTWTPTPLARMEFEGLLDVHDDIDAMRWAIRNSAVTTRKRERHVIRLLAEAVADQIRDGSDTYHLEVTAPTEPSKLLAGLLVEAAANHDTERLSALTDEWTELEQPDRAVTLASLLGDLIGHRLLGDG